MSQTVYAKDIQLKSTGTIFFGDKNTDGTFKLVRSGNDLIIYRRESSIYVEKGSVTT